MSDRNELTMLDEERMKDVLLPHLLQAYWGVSERVSGLVKNGDGVWRDGEATERRLYGDDALDMEDL